MPNIVVREFDICRDDKHDLTQANVWGEIYALLAKPNTVFITSPPCNTHSRARHGRPGPQPLRSSVWPRGFPWLSPPKAATVDAVNYMIDCSIKASIIAAEHGNQFLWEHPEHLGLAADGLVPASIWELPELLDVLARFHAITFALFQCQYGAPTSKPTRFLTSLSAFLSSPPQYSGLPRLDAQGRYVGPLPKTCPHGSHEGLIGKDPSTKGWRTAPSASYPPQLCHFLAKAVADSLLRMGSNKSSSSTAGQKAQSDSVRRDALPASVPQSTSPAPLQPKPQGLPQHAQQALGSVGPQGRRSGGSLPQGLIHQDSLPAPEGVKPAPACLQPAGLLPQHAPECLQPQPECLQCLQPQPECLQPPGLLPQPAPECLLPPRFTPQVPTTPDPVRFSPLGFRPEPVPEERASLGFSPESSKVKQSPNKSHQSGQGFPLPPPKVVGFSPSLDTFQGIAEPRKVPLFPLPGEAAEDFAGRVMAKRDPLDRRELEALHKLLPLEVAPRGEAGGQATAFVSGAYCKGGLVGLRKNTASMPNVCSALTRYVDQVRPDFVFSAVALFQGVKTPVHKDSRNAPFPNLVTPVGQFSGGAIWVEDPEGCIPGTTPAGIRMGRDLEVDKGTVVFNAFDSFHFTRAWKGNRLVLVAYTTDRTSDLSTSDASTLRELGFRLPPAGSETKRGQEPAEPFHPEWCGNRGLPVLVEWESHTEAFTDGFGLCSPTRWRPGDRGGKLTPSARDLCHSLHQLGLDFVREQVKNPRALCQNLENGELEESPFTEEAMTRLRQRWCLLVGGPDWEHLAEIPPGQPFLLKALARTAEIMGDPDWEILTEGADNYCTGVPLGFKESIPLLPQVYDPKTKWRRLDEDLPEWDRPNYSSATLNSQQLLEKFRDEERLGRMASTTLGALRQEYAEDRIRVASMGAIRKPDGSVRPVHDGTHGVHVNQEIQQLNLLAVPGPAEVAWMVRQAHEQKEPPFAITGDVAAAHRLVRIRRQDWGLLACRAESESPTLFINKVGTFGISSASLWWSRLFGIVGRMVGRAMLNHFFYQLAFVDDLHANFFGPRKHINALLWLVLYLMVGTPFAWKKFKGGLRVAFIGYELDYGIFRVGMSDARGAWLVSWIQEARRSRFVVATRKFSEFLGRLGFVSRLLYWLKPHLAPLYAWAAATHRCAVGRLPDTVILTLMYIEDTFAEMEYKVSPLKVSRSVQPAFFTDAKCEDGLVVLGGWESLGPVGSARWFPFHLVPRRHLTCLMKSIILSGLRRQQSCWPLWPRSFSSGTWSRPLALDISQLSFPQ